MSNPAQTQGNSGVVGLAGFGLTTLLLQFHNVGWCGVGPVLALAIVFGGLAQMIAGFQEFKGGTISATAPSCPTGPSGSPWGSSSS